MAQTRPTLDQLNRERLTAITNDVITTITSPEFVEKMRLARAAASSDEEGLRAASNLLTLDGLRQSGVDVPADFRLTSRWFEDKVSGTRIEIREPNDGQNAMPARWSACAGGGAATICGCAGVGT